MATMVVLAVAAVAASVALAGCGGDEPLSKQALIERGDAVCAEAEQQANALGEPRTAAEATQLRAVLATMVDELRALEPPAQDRGRIDVMLDDLDRGMTTVGREVEQTLRSGGKLESVEENDGWRLVERAASAARSYGFEVCGGDA